MSAKQEADAARLGTVALLTFLGGFLLARQFPSSMPTGSGFSYFESFYGLLESVAVMGSPAQLMVALLGLCLYPALSRTSRSVDKAAAVGSSAPSTDESTRRGGPGSHSIQLESTREDRNQQRQASNGFFKRLRRALAVGRAQARQLCGRSSSLQSAVSSLSRKRSFGSRSSKSEDVLSSRLSMDSGVRSSQQAAGGGPGRRGAAQRKAGAGGGGAVSGSRWRPSMSRINSGQHLANMAPSCSSISSATAGKRLEILSYNGFQAVDCLSHETTAPDFEGVRQVVTDMHLLQFGAMIGEASAELALSQAGSTGPVSADPGSLFGTFDRTDLYRQGWELIVEEHKPGLHYWNWRRHLRRGLYMYKSKTVYETATTAQIMDFTYDVEFRKTWDDSMACQLAIPPPPTSQAAAAAAGGIASCGGSMSLAEADAKAAGGRSAYMYARTKFPPPMASREYTYARRCWAKPDDGGCYCISRACAHPSPPQTGGRTVRVTDFVSGYVIRSGKGVFDTVNPAVEVVNVYFEDPCVPSGIVNMGIRRALWPMVQKAEAAFRDYLLTKVHGNLEQPPPERAVALDAFGAAMPANGAQAARAAAAGADAASCMGGLPAGFRRPWTLSSPYVLLYRGYMAAWRGGRGALLAALGACMSLWCNATGLFVGGVVLVKGGLRAAVGASRTLLAATATSAAAGYSALKPKRATVAGILARLLWPWEVLARGRGGGGGGGQGAGLDPQASRSGGSSSGGSSGGRLASHPLPRQGVKRLAFAPAAGGEGCAATADSDAGGQSPRATRRARGGLARRCAVLAVKVVKLAGAGLLVGRAARGKSTASTTTTTTSAATSGTPGGSATAMPLTAMGTGASSQSLARPGQAALRQQHLLPRAVPA